jgi:hypothetical protein
MVALLAGSAVLACFGACGVALLRRVPALDPNEALVYGVPLGWAVASLALLVVACATGLHAWLVVLLGLACAGVAWSARGTLRWSRPHALGGFALVVLAAFALRWLLFWGTAFPLEADGLWASQLSLWGDGAQHLGDITSFAYGGNFPPHHPRFPGHAFNYHYLAALTSAALVKVGMTPWAALALHSFFGSVFIALAVFVFGRRLGLGPGPAATALLLFVLGGGLGWWGRLAGHEVTNLRWLNMFFALLAPQRGLIYGVPLGLLVLRLLAKRSFVAAGAVAALLPYAHLGTFLTLALLTPILFLAFPTRRWLGFFGTWVLLGAPQILLQQAGSASAASAIRWLPGWVAPPDPWIIFWLKNLGAFAPLLVLALFVRSGLPDASRRLLLAFQPLFLVANLVVFQPWDWDNTKILMWWYLASCFLVAALFAWMWKLGPATLVRPAIATVVLTMTMSGVLENLDQARGKQRHLLLTTEEIDVARRVRALTPRHALFVVGLQHNHPVPVLSGRRVLMGYGGWLWSQGIDYKRREAEVRSIYALAPEAPVLIERYGVAYVVIGPDERKSFGVDPEAWRARYPSILKTDSYEIFSVAPSPGATGATRAPASTAGSR